MPRARVQLGDGDLYVAGGVESMTRAPYVLCKASKPFARDVELFDTSLGWRFVNPELRETLRHRLDGPDRGERRRAVRREPRRSGRVRRAVAAKAAAARRRAASPTRSRRWRSRSGRGPPKRVDQDEFIRPDTTVEVLAKLKPAFRTDGKGSVTAGNSSGLNDGAAALLVASEQRRARASASSRMTRIVATAVAGVEPRCMGIGPVPAIAARARARGDHARRHRTSSS